MIVSVLRNSFFTVCACIACCGLMRAQIATSTVVGDYTGTQGQLHFRLRIQTNSAGSLICFMDIVDQDAFGIPCTQLALSGAQFSFAVPDVQGTYKGSISTDGDAITGTWDQGLPMPLVLIRKPPATVTELSAQLTEIDAMVANAYNKKPSGGLTIGVVSDSQLIWTKSYGNADTKNHLPANIDTVYRIGSITKMFTAVMLEQLVETGKVHLSDPVRKYYPEIDNVQGRFPNAPPITLIQLATHTSGLGLEPDNVERYVQGPVADWEKTLIAALPHVHYVFEPGIRFSYSNIGYAVLGAALARAAGEPYLEYVPAHIFRPLGMAHTALKPNAEIKPYLSTGYEVEGDKTDTETPLREQLGRGYKVPNGTAYTNVKDLARFASFLMGNGPESALKATSLEQDLDQIEVPSNSWLTGGYGLGFMVTRRDGYVAFGHSGDVAGYQAALYINRDKKIGLIVLANVGGSESIDAEEIALKSLDLLSK